MSVQRQANLQGQQRVDVPHLRAFESAVAADFDVLGGHIMAGGLASVVTGFDLVTTDAVGNDASALVLTVGGGTLLHFEATEAGSVFRFPDDQEAETLGATNAKVIGSFTPSATNFIGLDIIRVVDDSTADTVMFLNTTTDTESPRTIPLGRTIDYRIVVSTTEFSATPGLAPLAKVVTDASNKVTSLTDARHLFFRLGSGGTNPLSDNAYSWPGGRTESGSLATIGGDRSISCMKDWMNAAMTRLWEVGGGEYWFSNTADRNVRMCTSGTTFTSTGNYFEVVSDNLHWRGLKFLFDNSTATTNEVEDQLTSVVGLTDLADGECIYVDLDRAEDHTVVGTNPLVAQKGVLRTLGGSSTPGQRFVIAWAVDNGSGVDIHIRDQSFIVGTTFNEATTTTTGVSKISMTTASAPIAVGMADDGTTSYTATCGGVSHNLDLGGAAWLLAASDIVIGRGVVAGDNNVVLSTDDDDVNTSIVGAPVWTTEAKAALDIAQQAAVGDGLNRIVNMYGTATVGGTPRMVLAVESDGAVLLGNVTATPGTPAPAGIDVPRMKYFARKSGSTPNARDQFCVMWHDGTVTVLAESPLY